MAQSWQSNKFLKNFVTIREALRYGARYYDPSLQRFLSEDPIGFDSEDFNFYRYVMGDPVNLVDPWGLKNDSLGDKIWNWCFGEATPSMREKSFCELYKKHGIKGCDIAAGILYPTCGINADCRIDVGNLYKQCMSKELQCQ